MPSRTSQQTSEAEDNPSFDPILEKLLNDDFNAVDFLNTALPPLSLSGQTSTHSEARALQLQDAFTEIQKLLSRLNAHNIRSSNLLTQITDEILRSGSRLAYEVEILRGDVNSLHTTLTESLQDDIRRFVPDAREDADQDNSVLKNGLQISVDSGQQGASNVNNVALSPSIVPQLQTLQTAKSRLEDTIRTFGEAMNWPLPPQSPTLTSSLISVSAPELGLESAVLSSSNNQGTSKGAEANARAINNAIRAEVTELADRDLEAAEERIEHLRVLATVWKGTSEEKPRAKFVDSLSKIVEERRKGLGASATGRHTPENMGAPQHRSSSMPVRTTSGRQAGSGGRTESPARGLLRNLQKLRDEIYLE